MIVLVLASKPETPRTLSAAPRVEEVLGISCIVNQRLQFVDPRCVGDELAVSVDEVLDCCVDYVRTSCGNSFRR